MSLKGGEDTQNCWRAELRLVWRQLKGREKRREVIGRAGMHVELRERQHGSPQCLRFEREAAGYGV